MELSTALGNSLLTNFNTTKIACPPTLNSNAFTTAALDNIDHKPELKYNRRFFSRNWNILVSTSYNGILAWRET